MTDTAAELFERNRVWAIRVARKYVRRVDAPLRRFAAGAVEQAALIGLWQAAARFDPARGHFHGYAAKRIIGAVQDEARSAGALFMHRRRAAAMPEVEPLTTGEVDSRPQRAFCRVDDQDEVEALLRSVPPRAATIFRAKVFDGQTVGQIRAAYKIGWGSTRGALRLCRKHARQMQAALEKPGKN